jgi:hypothetical protein
MGKINMSAMCPHYGRCGKTTISCEIGSLKFPDIATKIAYLRRYCESLPGYQDCTLAQSLTAYYEQGGKT